MWIPLVGFSRKQNRQAFKRCRFLCSFVCALLLSLWSSGVLAAGTRGSAEPKDDADQESQVHVLLINGGGRPNSNYLSHLHHLQDLLQVLTARGLKTEQITVFNADGEGEEEDLAARTLAPRIPNLWLVTGTRVGRNLLPRRRLENTVWEEVELHPATHAALRSWFQEQRKVLAPGDTLLIFVTDHGKEGEDDLNNGTLSLWDESLSVLEFRALLSHLKPGVGVVMVMSQCHSGTFANAIYGLGSDLPSGNICGFFSTLKDRLAYGCYPEGRDSDQMGYGFGFINVLQSQADLTAAHQQLLTTDDSPDVPLRTSDFYLQRLLQSAEFPEAHSDSYLDKLLEQAWQNPDPEWERELFLIDEIADQFGLPRIRNLTELELELGPLGRAVRDAKNVAGRWSQSFNDLKKTNLEEFLQVTHHQDWSQRLDEEALKELSEAARQELLAELLPEVVRFSRSQRDRWRRLERLREASQESAALRYRLQQREAAKERLRILLERMAGQVFLKQTTVASRYVEAWEALSACERFAPGVPPASSSAPPTPEPALEPLTQDFQRFQELIPSWLGISFKPVAEAGVATGEHPGGAVVVQRVVPDSPAELAGLEVDDVILGTGEEFFAYAYQIREWIMDAPRETPLTLQVERGREQLRLTVSLTGLPLD